MAVKRCTTPFSVWVDGSPRVYAGGQLVDERDPVLKTHAHLFEDVVAHVAARQARQAETATAGPDELRTLTPTSEPAVQDTEAAPAKTTRRTK